MMAKNKELIATLFIAVFFSCLFYIKPRPLEIIDMKIYDLFFHVRGKENPPDNIVIAAIDEASLEKLGRWPWSRDKIAKLIDKLSEYEAAVIALDIIFSESEKNDRLLAETISRAGNVILPVVFFFDVEDAPKEAEITESAFSILNPERFLRYQPVSSKSVLVPESILSRKAAGFGHINMFPDSDGTIRWEVLFINYYGYMIPGLPLKTAAMYLGIPQEKQLIDATKGVYLGKRYIPTDPWGRILIPYYGGNGSFKHISIADIVENRVKKDALQDKIILIGATAVGIYDLRVTPVSSALPGVEKHANVIASLMEGKSILAVSNYVVVMLILTSVFSGLFLYQRLKAGYCLIVLLIMLSGVFMASFYLFTKGTWLSVIYVSGSLFIHFLTTITLRYAYSEKQARQIKKIFSSYVTEKVVNELIKNPSMAKLGGERREVTVLFSDIRGFTTLSEKLPPEKVVELLNEYFAQMAEIIFKWEGTLDKFMGDAIMVFWNAPLSQNDHAERALNCTVEMIKKLRNLCKKWDEEGKPQLKIGIGINTGQALVGNIGAEGKKMDYTVIGDSVNLASRLEGLNKEFNSEIIISEFTFKKLQEKIEADFFGAIDVEELGEISVKGKEKPVKIFKVSVK
ncbi:adenylate/guanylate cyclase domain-containing protein [Thermodesulfovibrio sp. 3907-1M]|uniref:Adenylate/guanylate cyclase domain-containing protein n=1 Tax=Thermodesulfovibrio autotrophicus TaxID=3118333 RepID=A0AAU8GUY1_9BACT